MNTRHSLRFLAVIIPVLFLLAMENIARAAGDVTTAHPRLSSSATEKFAESPVTNTLILTDTQGSYPLGLHMDLLEDSTGNLTIDQVSSSPENQRFVPNRVAIPNYGYTNNAYWVRFTLENETRQTSEYLLEMGFANAQYVDLYSPAVDGVGFDLKQSGAARPISSRDVTYPDFVFNINIPPHAQQTYYLRIKTGSSMTIPLTLWTKNAFIIQSGRQLIFRWLIYGGLFALFVYHLFLLIRIKETSYLYFALMLAFMLIFLLDYSGYLFVYFLPELTPAKYYVIPLYLAGLYALIVLFSDSFLELKTKHPRLHQVNLILLVAWGVIVILTPFVSYLTIAQIGTPLQLITIGATWVIGALTWRRGARSSTFFMFAWLGMAASLFLVLLVRLVIIPSTYFNENMFQLGFLIMAVSWSMALADRIKELKDETETANRDLRNSEVRLAQILDGLPVGIVVYDSDQKPTYINRRTTEILGNPHLGLRQNPRDEPSFTRALESLPFQETGSDRHYPVEKTPLYRALDGIVSSTDDIELAQDGKRVPLEIWATPIKDGEGKVISAVAVFQDITQRKQAEAELIKHHDHLEELVNSRTAELDQANQQLKMRLDWLSEVIKSQQTIKGEASLAKVYTELANRIQKLLNARMVFILRWDYAIDQPEGVYNIQPEVTPTDLDFICIAFQKDTQLRQRFEIGKIASWSMDRPSSMPEPFKSWFQEHDKQFLIIAPMLFGKFFIGGLGIAGPERLKGEFINNQDLIERMAFDLASLTQDAILLDNTLALVASEERNRLARDLHDSVTQMLFTATLLTDVIPQVWRRDPEQGFQTLDKLRRLTRGALAEMRTLLIELRPTAMHNIPLGELLSQLTEAITSRSGVPFQLSIEKIPLLPDEVQVAFYRIAQEALNNVVKHAQAIRVTVSLSAVRLEENEAGMPLHQVKLVVQDDGVGFSTDADKPGHLGIHIMRERAAAIQAKFIIESQPGHGALVSLVWTGETKPDNQNE